MSSPVFGSSLVHRSQVNCRSFDRRCCGTLRCIVRVRAQKRHHEERPVFQLDSRHNLTFEDVRWVRRQNVRLLDSDCSPRRCRHFHLPGRGCTCNLWADMMHPSSSIRIRRSCLHLVLVVPYVLIRARRGWCLEMLTHHSAATVASL